MNFSIFSSSEFAVFARVSRLRSLIIRLVSSAKSTQVSTQVSLRTIKIPF
jgi:hypothetical protein